MNGSTTTIGKQLKIKIQPDNEFKLKNIKLRHGNNNSLRSPQFAETIFSADSLPEVLEISSCYIDGDLDFTADFESSGYTLYSVMSSTSQIIHSQIQVNGEGALEEIQHGTVSYLTQMMLYLLKTKNLFLDAYQIRIKTLIKLIC